VSEATAPAAVDARTDRRASLALVAALLALEAFLFRHLFTDRVSILNGDSLIHSLPMHRILSEWAHGGIWRFWQPDVAFGHPVYAEGTGGFFHPFAFALFACFDWLTAHDLLYVSSFALTGVFAFAAARALGLVPLAAGIAAVAAAFSPSVLWNAYNASYAHAIAWSAATLWAFERWDEARNAAARAWLGGAVALLFLAGYPPLAYATLVFLGIVAAVRALGEPRTIVARALGLGGAAVIGIALAAFQVLPLLELSAQSTRRSAVDPVQVYPIANYLVGLFLVNDPALYRNAFLYFLAPLGTMLALLGVGFAPLQRNRFALSYVLAIAVCVSAAAGAGSVFYELFRTALPGFDRLRQLSPFLLVTVVPCAVLLATSIDAGLRQPLTRGRMASCAVTFAIGAALVALAEPTHAATAFYLVTSAAVVAVAGAAVLVGRRTGCVGVALGVVLAVLVVESTVVKGSYVSFFPDATLAEANPLATFLDERLREDPGARVAHLWSRMTREQHDLLVYSHWKNPGYEKIIRANAARLVPSLNLLHDIATLDASDALPLAGVPELRAAVLAELQGRAALAPGQRWIDRLHIRYVIADAEAKSVAADLHPVWRDPTGAVQVLENPSAGAAWAKPPPDAMPLVVQPADAGADSIALRPALASFAPAWIESAITALPFVHSERAGPIDVELAAAGPVYVPLPAYPGWSAWLDGERAPLRLDDSFGMWLDAAAGHHQLELRFVPLAFYAGALASAGTLLGVVAVAVLRRRRLATHR
jgi:hypothetical protein